MSPGRPRLKLTPQSMQMCGIPALYWPATVDKIPATAAHKPEVLKAVAEPAALINNGLGFILTGASGAGKTASACIVAKAVKAHGGRVWFSRADEVMAAVVERWVRPGDDGYTQHEYWRSAHLWVVDDLGTALGSEQTKAVLEREIRWRLSMGRSVIVTTNDPMLSGVAAQVRRAMGECMLLVTVEDVGLSRARARASLEWFERWTSQE